MHLTAVIARTVLVAAMVSMAAGLGTHALAQGTGGSFGGSNFGSSGSSGGSGGSYGGGSGGGGSYSGGNYSGSGSGGCDGAAPGIVVMLLVILVIFPLATLAQDGSGTSPPVTSPPRDVTAVSLAIDSRERRALQARLKALAKRGNTATPGGLVALFHETVIALRRVEKAWLYAGVVNATPTIYPDKVESKFRELTHDLRTRFQTEVIRAVDGHLTEEAAPELTARPEEGAGVVVVSLVVAVKGEIPDVAQARDAAQLRHIMRRFGGIPASQLLGMEVIWSPAEEDDRMSTAELEILYPELEKIAPDSIAGRVFCRFCSFPFAAELGQCPNCGAPTPKA